MTASQVAGARVLGAVIAAGVGCHSAPPEDQWQKMPFRVAIMPVRIANVGAEPEGDASVVETELAIGAETLARALEAHLEQECFIDATLLSLPAGFEQLDADAQAAWWQTSEEYWRKEAVRDRADLLLDCRLDYSPTVKSEKNGKFWLNVPLFLLGGPFNYFVDDRDYLVRANLSATLKDITVLGIQARADLDDGERQMLRWEQPVSPSASKVQMDFTDRIDFNGSYMGSIGLSFLVPAGFLATSNDAVKESLAHEVAEAISNDLVIGLKSKSEEIDRASFVAFWIGETKLSSSRTRVHVRTNIYLHNDPEGVEQLDSVWIDAGGEGYRQQITLPQPVPASNRAATIVYPVDVEVPLAPGAETVQLRIQQLDRWKRGRTYTFPRIWPVPDVSS